MPLFIKKVYGIHIEIVLLIKNLKE